MASRILYDCRPSFNSQGCRAARFTCGSPKDRFLNKCLLARERSGGAKSTSRTGSNISNERHDGAPDTASSRSQPGGQAGILRM
jgi:hypothetical protein